MTGSAICQWQFWKDLPQRAQRKHGGARSFPTGAGLAPGADRLEWLHVAFDLGGKLILGDFQLVLYGSQKPQAQKAGLSYTKRPGDS